MFSVSMLASPTLKFEEAVDWLTVQHQEETLPLVITEFATILEAYKVALIDKLRSS